MKTLPLWLSLTLGFFDNFHDRDKGVCVKPRRTESKNHSLSCSIIWWNWRSPPSLIFTETPWFGSQSLFCLWPDVSVEQRQLFEQMFKQRASGGRRSYCWKHSEDQVASAAITEVRERIKNTWLRICPKASCIKSFGSYWVPKMWFAGCLYQTSQQSFCGLVLSNDRESNLWVETWMLEVDLCMFAIIRKFIFYLFGQHRLE